MNIYETLLEKLHNGKNPYTGFPSKEWAGAWWSDQGSTREAFKKCIERTQPGLIIEVGSFVGESSIHMAKLLKNLPHDSAVLCVDTWMGGIDHWEKVPEKLRFHFGRPSLFYQFMGNVIEHGQQDKILPLSLDSNNAARLLKRLGITARMIYVDGSHEEGDVLRDYEAYWDLLEPQGVLLVDDLTNWFPGVMHDWDVFCKLNSLTPEVEGEKGMLVKP